MSCILCHMFPKRLFWDLRITGQRLYELNCLISVLHIEKAQRVEAEIMGIHREEVNQLQKIISQKDDDLKRSIERYEQILQVQKKYTFS